MSSLGPSKRSRVLGGALALPLALAILGTASSARADAAGWLHTGGGVLVFKDGSGADLAVQPTMAIDAGVGSSTQAPFIFGGYFRAQPVFGEGLDLALFGRFCNQGFQQGVIGFAIDLGAYQRLWGEKSTGFVGQAVLSGPLGLQLAGLGSVGSHGTFGFGGTLGIDFVRLFIDRQHLTEFWPNMRPSDAMYDTAALRR
ncbi:MAG: hypothetical protein KC731_42255 [Myxococcales bacterium]|nr:hypothetical protein [Myxococcales bacterium]